MNVLTSPTQQPQQPQQPQQAPSSPIKVYRLSRRSAMADRASNGWLLKWKQNNIWIKTPGCNGVQREHNKKLNNGLPILHKVPPKRDYGRYFCIMAEKGGTSHGA